MNVFPFQSESDVLDVNALQQVLQLWNQGMQDDAIGVLLQRSAAGSVWPAPLIAWLSMQDHSLESMERGLEFARRAADLGYAPHIWSLLNNVIGVLPGYPQLADRVLELVGQISFAGGAGFDLLGQAWNLLNNGQVDLALRLLKTPSPLPVQYTEAQLKAMLPKASDKLEELAELTVQARQHESEFSARLTGIAEATEESLASERTKVEYASSEAIAAMAKARDELETRAQQAGLLVSSTTSEATNALYAAEALRNTRESKAAWGFGLGVLGVAAVVAVLPVVLHYLHIGPTYTSFEQIALHLVSTAALASWAGVMLARARSRDQAAQRAHDLSTAMGTMISYSNQIRDDIERERFMTMMGQMVLQAHLTTNTKGNSADDSLAGLLALMNMVKPTAVSSSGS